MSLCLSAFHYARVQRGAKIGNGRELRMQWVGKAQEQEQW